MAKPHFYDSYHIDAAPISDTDCPEVYWEGPEPATQPGQNGVTVTVTVNGSQMQKQTDLKHRLLQQGSQGDDVKMLQDLLNFLGWPELMVDGDFGGLTGDRVIKFKKQNYGTWTSQNEHVDIGEVKILNYHFDDYRLARNAFGWHNGENPDPNNATIIAFRKSNVKVA